MARLQTALALAMALTAVGLMPAAAVAQSTEQPAKAPKKKAQAKAKDDAASKGGEAAARDPAEVQKALDVAAKSLDAGKFDLAINQANAVMEKGGLEVRATARALAIRGQAYKKQGKPAQAIADLQSAIWLKNGLNDTERAAALKARSEAYAEAGLNEPSQRETSRAQASANPATGAQPAAEKAAPASASGSTTVASATTNTPPATGASSSSGIGDFFSNLFGGGSSKAAPDTTASVTPTPAAPAQPKEAAVSSWSDTTRLKSPPGKAAAKTAAVQAPATDAPAHHAAPAAKAAAPAGHYKLQLAAVKSKEEAEELAAKVKAGHPDEVAGRKVEISEATFGNMGTFYRARIGPYESREKTLALCSTLRGQGVDCMVLDK